MGNEFYKSFMGGAPIKQQPRQPQPSNPMSNMMNAMKNFQDFKSKFTGNPKEQVMQLLNSGQVSQEQYDQAVQMANTFRSFF